ncbi:hypothetical protein [Exiguobacterium oxidotolerans]|uniref:Glycosyl transferase family 28 C-terminal domain-containing protein n=1 Tax=Exiguobacterium oxidotolerans TaxID=223958 RepID=A0A653I9T0_9BACL|nr:hypothetical protein [Exiguobacterium oxidotolerans]VWX35664.1 conserved hypothetical protein [Exiguobacterium oxidotolerans]
MNIAYYISDYGYGHATRSVAIIRELLKKNKEIKITVCHSFAQDFLKNSLNPNRVSFRTLSTDGGYIVNSDTLELDYLKIQEMYDEYLFHREEKIRNEIKFLMKENISFVISDIYPTAIEAAYSMNIPSIGISNFLWTDVYKNIVNDSKLKVMECAYAKMTHYLHLKGHVSPKEFIKEYDFFSREIDEQEVNRIKENLCVSSTDTVIFYGLGMKIDHSYQLSNDFPLWSTENCKFIVSAHIDVDHPNVFKIPSDYAETQNYIAASDVTITKPGWSTVGEALMGNSNLLILKRDSFIEDRKTIHALESMKKCRLLSLKELKNLKFEDISISKDQLKNPFNTSGLMDLVEELICIMDNYRKEEFA